MKTAVIVFPGSNCDRDLAESLELVTGEPCQRIWHQETELPEDIDLVGLPGGFSYGDYLRCGALAATSPIIETLRERVAQGLAVIGICNGFQILCETGLLPGMLMPNAKGRFVHRDETLRIESTQGPFLSAQTQGAEMTFSVAHHDGSYQADVENKLSAVRRFFNSATKEYNNAVQTFPSNIIAGMFSFILRGLVQG